MLRPHLTIFDVVTVSCVLLLTVMLSFADRRVQELETQLQAIQLDRDLANTRIAELSQQLSQRMRTIEQSSTLGRLEQVEDVTAKLYKHALEAGDVD